MKTLAMRLVPWMSMVTLLSSFQAAGQPLPNYTPTGISIGDFNSFEQEYLGNGGYFNLRAITPNDARQTVNQVRDKVVYELAHRDDPWYSGLIPGWDDMFTKFRDIAVKTATNFEPTRYFHGGWGFEVANAQNDPGGPDNLFVGVDPNDNWAGFLDFLHLQGFEITPQGQKAAEIFKLDLKKIKIPRSGEMRFPQGVPKFKKPKGITSDGSGNFWIADEGNNRVVQFLYHPGKVGFEYRGSVKGLSAPIDVAWIKDEEGAVLVIVNNGNNSLAMVDADFGGLNVSFKDLPGKEKNESRNFYGSSAVIDLFNPRAVASSRTEPGVLFVAHRGGEIDRLERASRYSWVFSGKKAQWPASGELTSLKTDPAGDLFALDNTNGYLGKYTPNLTLVFTTGGTSFEDSRKSDKIGFNRPVYLAFGRDSKSVYVSEKFEGWSGIKRFYNWPRFIGSGVSFTMDCNTSTPINERSVTLSYEVTKGGLLDVKIYQAADLTHPTEILLKEFSDITITAGKNSKSYVIGDLGFPFDETATFRLEFSLHDAKYADENSDFQAYWTDFRPTGFIANASAIGPAYFNPLKGAGKAEFNVNRDANITFKLAGKDIVGTPTAAQFVVVNGRTTYQRSERDALVAAINIKSTDLAKITEMRPYTLWAEVEAIPCGGVQTVKLPLSPQSYFYLDMTSPTAGFTSLAVTKFNPNSVTFGKMPFTITGADNSNDNLRFEIDVHAASDLNQPLRYGIYQGTAPSGSSLSSFWDGKREDGTSAQSGEYVFALTVTDLAGNATRLMSSKFLVDTDAPDIALSLAGSGHSFGTFQGKTALMLFRDQSADIGFTYSDRFPKELSVSFDKLNPADASAVSTFTHSTLNYNGSWPATFRINAANFPGDGIYGLDVFGIDQVGNTSRENPTRSMSSASGEIPYVWVNQKPPLLTVKLTRNVIKSGGSTELIVSAYNQGSFPGYTFSYNVTLIYGTTTRTGFATGTLDPKSPTAVIPFDHTIPPYSLFKGRFTFKVTLQTNLGSIGNSQEQSAYLFVDSFPPQWDGTDGQDVPQKFLLSGQVGDPNPTNDQNQNGLEYYAVYYKLGTITALPANLNGWMTNGVSVPYHKVDRNGPNAAAFPHSSLADNPEAGTSALGNGVLAYVNAGASGANLTVGSNYTFLVLAKEKNLPISVTAATAALRSVNVTAGSGPRLEALKFNGSAAGDIDFAAGSAPLIIGAHTAGGAPGTTVDAALYLYSETPDLDGDGVNEPIVARLERLDIPVNSDFEITWDGTDGKGSYVKSGRYIAALVLEQKAAPIPPAFDALFSTGRKINVTTPLVILDGTFGPGKISASPQATGAPENTATFKYKVSKASKTFLEVQDASGARLFDVGPELNQDGAGVFHLLGWNGVDPLTHTPVPYGRYRVLPFAVDLMDPALKVYYSIPGAGPGYYELEVGAPRNETPALGTFEMPAMAFGSSDVYWETNPKGKLWRLPDVSLASPVRVKITGEQTLRRYVPVRFTGDYIRMHQRLSYKVKMRFGIERQRVCNYSFGPFDPVQSDYASTENRVGGTDWLSQTYAWNQGTQTGQTHSVQSPYIDFNSTTWDGLVPGSGWGSRSCGGGSWFSDGWNPVIRSTTTEWAAIFSNADELLDVIYTDDIHPVPIGSAPPTRLFTAISHSVGTNFGDSRASLSYSVENSAQLRQAGNFPAQYLTPGQVLTGQVDGHGFGSLTSVIDPNGYFIAVDFLLPPGGAVNFTKPYVRRIENLGTATEHFPYIFQSNLSIPTGDKMGMPMEFTYSYTPASAPMVDVPNVPFPFPPQSGCGTHDFPTSATGPDAGTMAPIWSTAQNWVMDNVTVPPRPRALHPNPASGCDFLVDIPAPTNLHPGETRTIPLSSLVPPGVAVPLFAFEDNSTTRDALVNGQRIQISIINDPVTGSIMTLHYPVIETNAAKIAWNPTGITGADDPILLDRQGAITGYMGVGGAGDVFNAYELPFSQALPNPFFSPLGADQDLFRSYKSMSQTRRFPLPPYAETQGTNWMAHPDHWKYAAWPDAAGNPGFHWGLGLDADGWDVVRFKYIDGSPSRDWELYDDKRTLGAFTPGIRPLAAPKRWVPIVFRVNLPIGGLKVNSILAFKEGDADAVWEPIPVRSGAERISFGSNIPGYWDVTGKSGVYFIRILVEDGAGNPYQVTRSIKIGTEVESGRTASLIVPSPLKKAELEFPAGSEYTGLVSVDPVSPRDLPGFDFGNVPKGPVVDVNPSGLVFDENDLSHRPILRFRLTREDILASGGSPDHLGDIGVYYLNEKTHALEQAAFTPTVFELNDPDNRSTVLPPSLASTQGLELAGTLDHTSLYGAFSLSSFVTIDPVVSPTSSSTVTLSGRVGSFSSGEVYLYVSAFPKWDASATLIDHVMPGTGGAWTKPAFPLPFQNANYIFASLGAAVAVSSEPTNSILVVKDADNPVISSIILNPGVSHANTRAIELDVTLSETGTAKVYIPQISGEFLIAKTSGTANLAVISIPLVSAEGVPLAEGTYPFFVSAVDLIGNVSTSTASGAFTVDRTPPVLTLNPVSSAGLLTGNLQDNFGISKILVEDQIGNPVKSIGLSGLSAAWTLQLDPADFVSHTGSLKVVGFDLGGNPSNAKSLPLATVFPSSLDGIAEVFMRESALGESDIAKPFIYLKNVSSAPLQGFTLRLWISREEAPDAEIALDPYTTDPCGIRFKLRTAQENPNAIAVDIQFPNSYILAPGQATPLNGLGFALHYKKPHAGNWGKSNDWSWTGVDATFKRARNVSVYGQDGKLIGGIELNPADIAPPLPATAPVAKERVSRDQKALYYFHEGMGKYAADISGVGIPMDLGFEDPGLKVSWIGRGGLAFNVQDHNALLSNRTPNPKIFEASVQSNELTLEAWITPANLTQVSGRIMGYLPANGNLERNWDLSQVGKNLEFRLRTFNSQSVSLVTTGNPMAVQGKSYHIVAAYKPYNSSTGKGGMRIYVNGVSSASNQESGGLDDGGANAWNRSHILAVGNRPAILDRDWEGAISSMAIYSSAFSDADALQNFSAGVREPSIALNPILGIACADRLLPSDIVDGTLPWVEDKSPAGTALRMNGVAYSKGLGGGSGANGTSSFLIYDLANEGVRLGVPGNGLRLTGFAGYQDNSAGVSTTFKISRAIRKPSDKDWLNNDGSVVPVFSSNNRTGLPIDLELGGARWLFAGINSPVGTTNPQGAFGDTRIQFGQGSGGAMPSDYLSGLNYSYYEGTWIKLPDFSTLHPVQQGLVSEFDLSPRLRNDQYAMEFKGYIRLSSGGNYTFFTSSDDGSRLEIDDRRLVDNDGVHGQQEASGSAYLAAGIHSIRVVFFQASGDAILNVSYHGPGIPKMKLPASELFRPGQGAMEVPQRILSGLQALYGFGRESGDQVFDLSYSGIPLDLEKKGSPGTWLEGGGFAFPGTAHDAIFENRTSNGKLFSSITQTGEISLEAWIELGDPVLDPFRTVMRFGSGAVPEAGNFSLEQKDRDLLFSVRTASSLKVQLVTSNQPLSYNRNRYHVVATYKPASMGIDAGMRIYVNGILQASNVESGKMAASGPNAWEGGFIFSVGNRPSVLDRPWSGRIFLSAVYNRSMTPEQITANFKAGSKPGLDVDNIALGVTSQERLLPWEIRDGNLPWNEDKADDGSPILLKGVRYAIGLWGKPLYDGSSASLLYNLESEREQLGISQPPLRLTGYAGRQSTGGDVSISIKTSDLAVAPLSADWSLGTGGVQEKLKLVNPDNEPVDVNLENSKWLLVAQSGPDASNQGEGAFGQLKMQFGRKQAGNMAPGLSYSYFGGVFDALPAFEGLSPMKTGIADQVNLSVAASTENFALEFRGFVQILTQGTYTFFSSSDDGSRVFVDGKLVVDNDGIHPMREISGSVVLSAGYHVLKIQYFEKTGGEGLEIKYQGPVIAKQPLPANALFHASSFEYGVDAKYFEGGWSALPSFAGMVPLSQNARNGFNIDPHPRADGFGFLFEGYLFTAVPGDYTFFLNSDDGSELVVDGAVSISNDGVHPMVEKSATVSLGSGFHSIRVAYFEGSGGEGLELKYQAPGIAKGMIPPEMLFRSGSGSIATGCSGTNCGRDDAISMFGENTDKNYSINGSQWFRIPLASSANTWAKKIMVSLDDMNGRPMEGKFKFETGADQTLYTYYQSFPTSYTGQSEVHFNVTVPTERLYKVRWWYEP